MILIDALFINKGGGAVLLEYLIEKVLAHPKKEEFFFLLDPRFEKPSILPPHYTVIPNKIGDRFRFYQKNKNSFSKVLCFANTPPPIKLKALVYTYSHNQKLFEAYKHKFKKKYRSLYLKYLIIKLYNNNTDYYIVQTKHMVNELVALRLKDRDHCLTIPFYNNRKYLGASLSFENRPHNEFVFVSTPSPQKNHTTLFDAWDMLFDRGYKPVLHVTIDHTAPYLTEKVIKLQQKGVNIVNYGFIDPRELYFTKPYLIYPSTTESFGLPLLEGVESGMKVIAADMEYVRDVIVPSLVFDPLSATSIADAVIKALNNTIPLSKVIATNDVNKLIDLLIS